jgi:hypothetical protein
VPNGKKWKMLRVYVAAVSNGTSPIQVAVQIFPNNLNAVFQDTFLLLSENLAYINVSSPVNGDSYYGYGSIVGAANLTFNTPINAQLWQDYPILYAGDAIEILTTQVASMVTQIWYVESDI